jgi:uncharacterized protein
MTENKKDMNRRAFLKTTGIGGASLALSAGLAGRILAAEEAKETPSKPVPKRTLGKTGISVPILTMGGITDWTTNPALLKVAFNMGLTYWDTADGYVNGRSEMGIGQHFEKYPDDRKKVFLASKHEISNPEGMTRSLNASLDRLKTDYVDLYFMHAVMSPDSLTQEAKAWAEQKKKEGKIKFYGFTAHMNVPQLLTHAASLGWIDAIMHTYNYRTMTNDEVKKSVDACARAGVGLVAMKAMAMRVMESETPENAAAVKSIMTGGFTQEQARLKAVWKDEKIASACVAMYSMNVLKDNLAAATDTRQLSMRETEGLNMLAENTRSQYCLGCTRCSTVIGAENRIPDVMRYMMYYNSYGEKDHARRQFAELPETVRRTLSSRDYSAAESLCPQGIRIGAVMREAVRILG